MLSIELAIEIRLTAIKTAASVPKLGLGTHPRNSTAILDRGNYSRGSPEQ